MDLKDKNVQNLLLGILVLMALIPIVWNKTQPKPAKKLAVVASVAAVDEKKSLAHLPGESTFRFAGSRKSTTENLKEEVLLTDAPESIRARYVSMPLIDGKFHFTVKIKSEGRCMQGDLDIIKKELRFTTKPRLILTLENMGPSSPQFERIVQEIDPKRFDAGASFNFAIPELNSPQHVGLFLCLDSAQANSCKNKPVFDLVDVANRYVKGRSNRLLAGKRISDATDKMYFFHHFLIDRERLIGFDTTIDDSDYSDAEQYLQSVANDGGVTGEVIDRAQHLNQKIRSMPAKITKRYITVNLPHEQQGKCAERNIVLPPQLQRAMEKRGGTIRRNP